MIIWEGGREGGGCYGNKCICCDISAQTQFSSAQFSSAELSSVQLSSAWLTSAQFGSARFSSFQLSSAQLSSAQFSSVHLISAQFSSEKFSSSQFSSVPRMDRRPSTAGVFRYIMAEMVKKCLSVLLMTVWITVLMIQNCLAPETTRLLSKLQKLATGFRSRNCLILVTCHYCPCNAMPSL